MRYYYQCENDYCNHKWYDNNTLMCNECPYCGCKFVKIEKMPDLPKPKSKKNKKK